MADNGWFFEAKLHLLFCLCQLDVVLRQTAEIKSYKWLIPFVLAFYQLFWVLLYLHPLLNFIFISYLLDYLYLFAKEYSLLLFNLVCTHFYPLCSHSIKKLTFTVFVHSYNCYKFATTIFEQAKRLFAVICERIKYFPIRKLKTYHIFRLVFGKWAKSHISIWKHYQRLTLNFPILPKTNNQMIVLAKKHAKSIGLSTLCLDSSLILAISIVYYCMINVVSGSRLQRTK